MLVREYRKGKRFVLIIDEAQNLDNSVLEVVRMLSNFENSAQKLIQIILSGQPQLARKLASPEMLQLRQRLSMVARLKPFNLEKPASTSITVCVQQVTISDIRCSRICHRH